MADLQQYSPEEQAALKYAFSNPQDPDAAIALQHYQNETGGPHYTADNQLVSPTHAPIEGVSTDKPSTTSEAVRIPAGVAAGAAEFFNPAQIPHFAEHVYNFVGEPRDPNLGLLQSIKDRWNRAEAESIIPSVSASDIASGARAGIDKLAGTYGKDASLKDLFHAEQTNQKNLENEYVNKTAETGTQTLLGIVSLAGIVRDAANLAPVLESSANKLAFNSLKPGAKAAQRIQEEGRIGDIGEQLLKDKIVTPGASVHDILDRTENGLKNYGEQIGYYAKTADKARESDSSIRGVQVQNLISDIQSKVIEPLSNDPSTLEAANAVQHWVSNLKIAGKNIDATEDIPFQAAQSWKTNLGKSKAEFQRNNESITADAFQDVYRILNDHITNGIGEAFQKAAPELENQFSAIKQAYRNLSDAHDLISNTVGKTSSNQLISLSDKIMAVGGLVGAGAAEHGISPALIGGGVLGTINHFGRLYGNQVGANMLKTFAESPSLLDEGKKAVGLFKNISGGK